ncbi:MAG: N-acetylmuramoyl-L-alanine amidase [Desulfovibrio sp.]|nr:N-acetylmuramoyl-L-alanine amidase [Desulfovibrio sp.]MBI4959921.1 N-acetylmuramoyl-L-alanine amidase [Desulfovibrio sp.]
MVAHAVNSAKGVGMSRISRRSAISIVTTACLGLSVQCFASKDTGQELASKGHELLLSGKPSEALAMLKEAARLDPANPWVFNLLGRVYFMSDQNSLAAESFRMALRADPGDGYARMMLDVLSQKPLGPAHTPEKPAKHRKPSQIEEDARKELEAYAASGKPSGARLILIDPGHGGADKGVAGSTGLAEKTIAFELAIKVASAVEAQQAGVRVLLTRNADHDQPLWSRSALAGLLGADLFVSLHCAASLPGYSGIEIYSYSPTPSDPQAAAVADLENGVIRFERIQAPMVQVPVAMDFVSSWYTRRLSVMGREAAQRIATGLRAGKPLDTVTVRAAPLKVLANAGRPSVLLQTGFLSNQPDETALKNPEFLEKLADELARALTRSLG